MRSLDVLCRARELYAANPSHSAFPSCWSGTEVDPITAVNRANSPHRTSVGVEVKRALAESMGGSVLAFNATHTTEEVLEAWDEAIATLAGEREAVAA